MSKAEVPEGCLSLSVEINALDYVEKAYQFIKQTESDSIAWKWVVISLYGALYGFAIYALQGNTPERVIFRTKKGVMKLISFDEALRRCQDPVWMKIYDFSKHLQLSSVLKRSIHKLKNVLRNNFEHYIPTEEGIDLLGMPQIAMDVLNIIRFLALESGNCDLADTQVEQIESIISQSNKILKQSSLYKLAQSREA